MNDKPKTVYQTGPVTEPQVKSLEHGQGGPPQLAYTSNPIEWLISLFDCIPFFNLKTKNQNEPLNAAIQDDLTGFHYSAGTIDPGGSYGGFQQGGGNLRFASQERSLNPSARPVLLPSGGAVPLVATDRGVTGAWGSRRTGQVRGFGALPGGFPDEGVTPPPPHSPEEESKAIQEIRDKYVIGNLEDPVFFNLTAAGSPQGNTMRLDYSQMPFNSIIISVQTGTSVNIWLGENAGTGLGHINVPAGLPMQFMFNPKGRIITLGNPNAAAVSGALIVVAV